MDQSPVPPDPERLISEASSVEEMTQTRGWKIFLECLDHMRQQALYHTLSLAASEGGNIWRIRLALLDQIIGLPAEYVKAREAVYHNKELDKLVSGITG